MIYTSTMLSLFEAMRATTTDAYREHIQGTSRMIELVEHDVYSTTLFNQICVHVPRQMSVILSLITQTPLSTFLRRRSIKALSRDYPIFQRLMAQIAGLTELYSNQSNHRLEESDVDTERYHIITTNLVCLWDEY
ncbi:hypothetical protein AOQ84DRAFT_412117 [Glonium stellatum]|uniref:Uncharacterized protein n=1 Tax=Glonium stellatum TaxID=574774 RepID=A0A8E2JY03_9PEZI|nr:hypothetical protein AOQ84DRAFT_412117 [Glonium stellatum]